MPNSPSPYIAQSPHRRPRPNDDTGGERPAKRRRQKSQDRQRRELGLMRQSDGANAPSFVGSASGIYFIRSVYHALAKSRANVPPQTPDQNIVPGEEDQLDEAIPFSSKGLWTPSEVQLASERNDPDFDFDDLQSWTESYFENWHSAYPFIHAPTILEYLEQDVRSESLGELQNQSSPRFTIVRSILSISLADRRQSGHRPTQPVPAALVFGSFQEAMESIQNTLFNPSSIEALQAVVSVQLFLVSMLRLNGASRLGGMIVRMAFQMGLHRCPARYPGFDVEEAELRRRLFWTIYCIDRHLCQSLGLPLTIRDDDVDVCHFDDEKHHTGVRPSSVMDDRLRMLNFLTKHASIKGQIMELRNKSVHQRFADRDLATLIGARIDKWANEFQCYLETADDAGSVQVNHLHRAILSVLQHESVISLNRPLLALDKTASEYMAALQVCIRASRSVITILHGYLRSLSQGIDPAMHGAPLLWPSLTWCIWMSAFVLLHAAIEGEIPKPVARKLADQSIEVLRHLALRGNVWPNVCAVGIDDLFLRLLLDSAVTTPQSSQTQSSRTNRELGPAGTVLINSTSNHVPHQRINAEAYGHLNQAPCRDHAHYGFACTRPQPNQPNATHYSGFYLQEQYDHNSSLMDHANNVIGPSPSSFDPQTSIPWLAGPDAAATTSANIFEQFDIPFWMGDDQYSSLFGVDL